MRITVIMLISCLCPVFQLLAQDPGFLPIEWNEEESLRPSAMTEDAQGFLWIANQSRLFRYNGYEFLEFFPEDSIEGQIIALQAWGKHSVIAGTDKGWIWLAGQDTSLFPIRITDQSIQAFHRDSSGALWVGTYGDGLHVIHGNSQTRIGLEAGLKDEYIYDIEEDAQGHLWVGTDAGTACIDPRGQTVLHTLSVKEGMPDNIIRVIQSCDNGEVYFGGYEGGISKLKVGSRIAERIPSTQALSTITQLVQGSQSMWIGTRREGLLELPTGQKSLIRSDSGSTEIRLLYMDQEQNLWVSSRTRGLLKAFTPIRSVPLEHVSAIRALAHGEDGQTFYASEEGVFRKSHSQGTTCLFRPSDVSLPPVISLYADEQNRLWMGTFGGGLIMYHLHNGIWRLIDHRDGLRNSNILSITGSTDHVWVGTLGGVSKISVDQEDIVVESFTREDGISENFIYQVEIDLFDRLWIATDGAGITRISGMDFQVFGQAEGLLDDVIYSITTDKEGSGWALGQSGKIFRIDADSVEEIHVAYRSNRSQASGIVSTANGAILIIHDAGIDRYDPQTNVLICYGERAGIHNLTPDLNAHSTDPDGNIWIGSSSGVMIYQKIPAGTRLFPEIQFQQASLLFEPISEARLSHLASDENHLTFQFHALWYQDPEAVRYQHQLEGYDLSWISSQDRVISYPRLPYGTYRFQMSAGFGEQFPSTISRVCTIEAPVYVTWWFWLGLLLVTGAAGYWGIRVRDERLNLNAKREKENIQYQFDVLRSQVNPHFLFNSFNTLIALIDEDQPGAVHYVQRLSDLFRNMLEFREETLITLREELNLLTHYVYLQKQRYRENLNIDITISTSCLETLIPPLTLQMLVENAIKHNVISKKTPLHIWVLDTQKHIVISNPFQPKRQSPPSTGLGLENIRKRYGLLTEEAVSAVQENGKFLVTLPILSS